MATLLSPVMVSAVLDVCAQRGCAAVARGATGPTSCREALDSPQAKSDARPEMFVHPSV